MARPVKVDAVKQRRIVKHLAQGMPIRAISAREEVNRESVRLAINEAAVEWYNLTEAADTTASELKLHLDGLDRLRSRFPGLLQSDVKSP